MKNKILLIEDDIFLRKVFSDKLRIEGFNVDMALDGADGLLKIKNLRPNLVLLDLIMPKKNGFEVLEEMKMDNELKKIPVIVLSNLGQDSDVEKVKLLGAADYLIKANFSMKEIIKKVKFYLRKL
ncbi:MAG: response regulator [Patescibacteria group bacterium]